MGGNYGRVRPLINNQDGTHSVPLTRGMFATISSEDAGKVGRCNWHAFVSAKNGTVYAQGRPFGGKKKVYLHRYLLETNQLIDHRDGNGLNNTRENIRVCTNAQNMANASVRGNVPFKGVTYKKQRFIACVTLNGVQTYLGRFLDPIDAARAYDAKALELFGEFACTNASLGLLPSTP